MSEVCESCGRDLLGEGNDLREGACWRAVRGRLDHLSEADCYRLGYERTLARADRYEAEFAACKALLIAEQKRAERAEAERAEARAALERLHNLSQREGWVFCSDERGTASRVLDAALAAIPAEPARESKDILAAYPNADEVSRKAWAKLCFPELSAEPARSTSEPAPQNPPPSPTGDAE